MDANTNTLLKTFRGHLNESYRIQPTFDGPEESKVMIADEKGFIYTWEIADVRLPLLISTADVLLQLCRNEMSQ